MWRVQCQTIKSKIAINLRKSEKEHRFSTLQWNLQNHVFFSSLECLAMKIEDKSKINAS
jgi:hypothetical protein